MAKGLIEYQGDCVSLRIPYTPFLLSLNNLIWDFECPPQVPR